MKKKRVFLIFNFIFLQLTWLFGQKLQRITETVHTHRTFWFNIAGFITHIGDPVVVGGGGVLYFAAIPVHVEVSSEQLVRSRFIYTNRWVPMILQKI